MFPMQSEGVRKNMDEIEEIAKRLPMSPELRNLFNLVLPVAKQLGVFVDLLANSLYLRSEGALGQYDMVTNTTSVELFPFKFSPNYAAITDKGYAKLAQGDAGFLARNLTHELIHAVTRYATFLYQEQDNEVLKETFLTEKQIKAIEGLISLLDILNNDPDFVLEYGAKNIDELLANLTDPVFVKKLKNKTLSSGQSLYQRFLELILQLFNKKVTAYDEVTYILAELLSEPSRTQLALAEVEASWLIKNYYSSFAKDSEKIELFKLKSLAALKVKIEVIKNRIAELDRNHQNRVKAIKDQIKVLESTSTPTQQPVVETPPAPAAPVRPKPTNPSMEVVLAYTGGGANILKTSPEQINIGFVDIRNMGGSTKTLHRIGEKTLSYAITSSEKGYNVFKIVPIFDYDRGAAGYYAVGTIIPHGQRLDSQLIIQMLDEMLELAIEKNHLGVTIENAKKGERVFFTNITGTGRKTSRINEIGGVQIFKSITDKYLDQMYVDTSDTKPTSPHEKDGTKREKMSGHITYKDDSQLNYVLSNLQDPIFKDGKFVALVPQQAIEELPQWDYYSYGQRDITSQMNLPAVVPNAVPPVASAIQQLTIEDILEQAANNYIAMKKSKSRFFNANLAAETLNNSKFKSEVKRKFMDLNYNPSTPESTLIEQVIKPIYETFHC